MCEPLSLRGSHGTVDAASGTAATDLLLLRLLSGGRCRLANRCIRAVSCCRAVAVIGVGPRNQEVAVEVEGGTDVLHHDHRLKSS